MKTKRIGSSNSAKASKFYRGNIMTLYKKLTGHFIDSSKIGTPWAKRMQPFSMTYEAQWVSIRLTKLIVRQSKEELSPVLHIMILTCFINNPFLCTKLHAHPLGSRKPLLDSASVDWSTYMASIGSQVQLIPRNLVFWIINILFTPTSKVDDLSTWGRVYTMVKDGFRTTPNPHFTCLYYFTSINAYTSDNLLSVPCASLTPCCEAQNWP